MVGVAFEVVRGKDADLPEVLIHLRAIAIHELAQGFEVAVEFVEITGLIAAVVLDRLPVSRLVPRCGNRRGEGFVNHIDFGDRIPTDELIPAGVDRLEDAALVHVISEIDVVLAAHRRDGRDDDGRYDVATRGSPRFAEEGGREQPQRGGADDQASRADLQDEGDDQHRTQSRPHQVPEIQSLNFRGVLGKNGDEDVARQEERNQERQIQRSEGEQGRDRCLDDTQVVQRQGVDDGAQKQHRSREPHAAPDEPAANLFLDRYGAQGGVNACQPEGKDRQGDHEIGQVGGEGDVENARQHQLEHQRRQRDQQHTKRQSPHGVPLDVRLGVQDVRLT